uniref:SIR2 family protein n=1 Tax=unclassified Rhodococcus (in: high G+C Gram-positive bacteria) TaxID=192944 RepID=UPI0015962D3C|nr:MULTISPECIES: SIR2 family protein [unclassified Rhodococcus (in: high G+C Gram-positive bacteria)]
MTPAERLEIAVREGNAVVIIGAGVSAATTRNQPEASWIGLLKSGIELGAQHSPPSWRNLVEPVLAAGVSENNTTYLINAASLVSAAIEQIGDQAAANWLRDTVGNLPVADPSWIDAIGTLRCPLLTTNYDTLLESQLSRPTADRTDMQAFQAGVGGKTKAIVHLHGVWTNRETVALSEADYSRQYNDEAHKSLERAISSIKSIVYIGFGAGLADPNFAKLLEWHRRTFPTSAIEHFRLCKEDEISDLERAHRDSNITPVSYGNQYGDFPNFIRRISEAPAVRTNDAGIVVNATAEARSAMLSELLAETRPQDLGESVLADHPVGSVRALALAPILLPVPHSEYIARDSDKDERTKRLDPDEVCQTSGVTVLVAEDHGGLTVALKWLVLRASELDLNTAPLYITFKDRDRGAHQFHRLVRKQALDTDLIERRLDPLPTLSVAIDDYSPFVRKVSDSVITDIAEAQHRSVFVGCKSGSEADVIERLKAVGIEASVRYIGKLNLADVKALVKVATPVRHGSVTSRIIQLLQAERLPRNPYTVSLLIDILLRGEYVSTEASSTTILDQYMSILLGRGNPDVDTRYALGPDQSITALSSLASRFVHEERSVIEESRVVMWLEELIAAYDWPEAPVDLLNAFKKNRILVKRPGGVSFVRSSYLHLFSAKWATREPDFLSYVLQEPLRHSDIIRHYSALNRRGDGSLLPAMQKLLDTFSESLSEPSVFRKVERSEASDLFLERLENDSADDNRDVPAEPSEEIDPLDKISDTDQSPFPEVDDSQMPYVNRYSLALQTVSAVLRDSDEVTDLPTKQGLLVDVIEGWGVLLGLLAEEPSFIELRRKITADIISDREGSGQSAAPDTEEFSDLFNVIPCFMVAGQIESSLASQKLSVTLSRILDSGSAISSAGGVFAASVLLFFIKRNGWVKQVIKLSAGKQDVWVVRNFLSLMYAAVYVGDQVRRDEEGALLDYVASSLADRWKYKHDRDRVRAVEGWKVKLRKEREYLARQAIPDSDRLEME